MGIGIQIVAKLAGQIGFQVLPRRWVVERTFAWISRCRRLAVHGAGMLGKFFSESIEEIDQGPIEALRATGAGPIKTIIFGVLPQVITSWIAVTLYRFETNLRQATVLGMVGAGGIGFELVGSMKLFQYQDTAACILVIIAMVMVADYVSTRLRAWIQKGAR